MLVVYCFRFLIWSFIVKYRETLVEVFICFSKKKELYLFKFRVDLFCVYLLSFSLFCLFIFFFNFTFLSISILIAHINIKSQIS